MNDTLRRALADARLVEADVATQLGVDPKTVQRWITGRVPQRRHRWAVADLVGHSERDLWPQLADGQDPRTAGTEILSVYPHRGAIPRDVWRQLFTTVQHEISILVYAGLFLAEDAELIQLIADRARAGVNVRVLLGDPDTAAIAQRGAEEGIGDAIAAKIRNVMVLYAPLLAVDGVAVRLHDTPLYNSLYRGDDEVLVNTHVYGAAAAYAPVLHLRHIRVGDLVNTYVDSFERVWATAKPLDAATPASVAG